VDSARGPQGLNIFSSEKEGRSLFLLTWEWTRSHSHLEKPVARPKFACSFSLSPSTQSPFPRLLSRELRATLTRSQSTIKGQTTPFREIPRPGPVTAHCTGGGITWSYTHLNDSNHCNCSHWGQKGPCRAMLVDDNLHSWTSICKIFVFFRGLHHL
jgi:hypothetical protein